MNLLDLLIFLPILYFCYRGFANGLIREVLSIVGIILAVFLTFNYMDVASSHLRPFFQDNPDYLPFVSGAAIFIGTLLGVHLVGYLSKAFLETINLNFINRITGMAFGLLKSGIMISVILIFLSGFELPSQESRKESVLYPYIIHFAPWAYDAAASLHPAAEGFSETTRKTLDKYNPIQNFPIPD